MYVTPEKRSIIFAFIKPISIFVKPLENSLLIEDDICVAGAGGMSSTLKQNNTVYSVILPEVQPKE